MVNANVAKNNLEEGLSFMKFIFLIASAICVYSSYAVVEINKGASPCAVFDKIYSNRDAFLRHLISLSYGGDEYIIYESGFLFVSGKRDPYFIFRNGRLYNICDKINHDDLQQDSVSKDYHSAFGFPLYFANQVLENNGNKDKKVKWEIEFYEAKESFDWGLAIIAIPCVILDRLDSLVAKKKSTRGAHLDRFQTHENELSEEIPLHINRHEVEDLFGCHFAKDNFGLYYYAIKLTDEKKPIIPKTLIVKYDKFDKAIAIMSWRMGNRQIFQTKVRQHAVQDIHRHVQ